MALPSDPTPLPEPPGTTVKDSFDSLSASVIHNTTRMIEIATRMSAVEDSVTNLEKRWDAFHTVVVQNFEKLQADTASKF